MSRGESLCVKSISAGRTRRIVSSRTQPRLLRMAVRDLLFAFAAAPPFGFKGGMPFIPSRRDEAGSWLAGNLHSRERLGKLDLRCGSIA